MASVPEAPIQPPTVCSAAHYGPGAAPALDAEAPRGEAPAMEAGDFVLTHARGLIPALIRAGGRIRYRGSQAVYAHWSHAALILNGGGDLIEALGGGVQQRNLKEYRDTEYVIVHLPPGTHHYDREEASGFARHCLREPYGYLTIVSIVVSLLLRLAGFSRFDFGLDGQQICSGLVARSLERTGEIFTEAAPWRMMPADLAHHYGVREVGPRGTAPPVAQGVVQRSGPGRGGRR